MTSTRSHSHVIPRHRHHPFAGFTRREVDVLILVAMDCANTEIAGQLGISVRTVESHVRSMLRKAGRKSRAGLVAHCYASGILQHGVWPPQWADVLSY
ncbi:helix-turn-helix transcriptional regulator [Amycolatopsis acidicola]|uniref:Helix-turn-helix transcriptional regulator n=1 Tax=Amycolatopsis acidicola TaxID=2596893 RepID=A0A5N0VPE7_9PSEU|nr:helix-turn-helix transcriptional regulator [Amycolatopsis acidicola]KAA9166491.1 helix-turn-helix transcriptional regulator [Amycolatopsis acidicola]